MMDFGAAELLEEVVAATKARQRRDLSISDARNDELLSSIELDLKDLIPRADELLSEMAVYKKVSDLHVLTPMSLYCWYSDRQLEKMEFESIHLELKQKIDNIEKTIDRDKAELETFREDLMTEKQKIDKESQTDDYNKKKCAINNRFSNYESTYNELRVKLSKFHIPTEICPENIKSFERELENVKSTRDNLKMVANDRILAMSAKKELLTLKYKTSKTSLNY